MSSGSFLLFRSLHFVLTKFSICRERASITVLVKFCYLTEARTSEMAIYSDQGVEKNVPKRLRQLQKKWISSVASIIPEPWMPPGTAAHPPQRNCVHLESLSSVQEQQYIQVVMVYSATSMRNMHQKLVSGQKVVMYGSVAGTLMVMQPPQKKQFPLWDDGFFSQPWSVQ